MGQPGLREEVSQKQVGLHICKDLVQFCFRGHVSNIFFPPLFRGGGRFQNGTPTLVGVPFFNMTLLFSFYFFL